MQSDAKGSFASLLLPLLQNRIDEKDFSDIGFLRDVLVRMLAENSRKCRMA
jgi:hypothetical protein